MAITPGTEFGPSGEGYLRLSLSAPGDRIEEALGRIEQFLAGTAGGLALAGAPEPEGSMP